MSLPIAIVSGVAAISIYSVCVYFVIDLGTDGLLPALGPFVFGLIFSTPAFVYWRLRHPVPPGQGAGLGGSSASNQFARRFGQCLNFRQVVVLAVLGPLPNVALILIEAHVPDSALAEQLRELSNPIAIAIWLAFLFSWDHHIGRWFQRLRGPDADPMAPPRAMRNDDGPTD